MPTDDIVITNGALDALNLCLRAVTRPGDSVIVESPTFYGALQSLEKMGLHAIEVPVHPREGLDLQALAVALERYHPKACWLMTNFQNPLGCLMPDEKKRALVALLTAHDTPLIEDDVYGALYFGSNRPMPAKAFDTKGLVMHCSSFSKSLSPGYRIGWTAAGRYTRTVARLKITSSLSTCGPAQAAVGRFRAKARAQGCDVKFHFILQVRSYCILQFTNQTQPPFYGRVRPVCRALSDRFKNS